MNVMTADVLRMFYSSPSGWPSARPFGAFPQVKRWGGWGSNPRPADYEKYGLVHYAR
jgi:hypothetical protein